MHHLTEFPEQYKLINEQVAEVLFYYALTPEEEEALTREDYLRLGMDFTPLEGTFKPILYYDFIARLKNGTSYLFSAWTPEHIISMMAEEGKDAYIVSGLVMVREITVPAMLEALEDCLEQASSFGLEHFGIKQSRRTYKVKPRIRKHAIGGHRLLPRSQPYAAPS